MDRRRFKGIAAVILGLAVAAMGLMVSSSADATVATGTNGDVFYDTGGNITKVGPNGGQVTQLSFGGGNDDLHVNAAGTQLVSEVTGGFTLQGVTVGAAATLIPNSAGADDDPKFNPAGTAITFENGNDIFTMNTDGTNRQNLTNSADIEITPAWLQNGADILFDDDTAPFFISKIPAGGGAQTPLTPAGHCAAAADCTNPDGSANNVFALYARPGAAPNGVHQVLTSGGSLAATQLTNSAADNEPSGAPDSAEVSYQRGGAINKSKTDGSLTSTQLATPGTDPTWSNIGAVVVPPPGSGSTLSIANAPKAKKGQECVFPLTSSPAGEGTATVTVSGNTNSLDGAAPTTATFEADGSSSLTVNVKNKRKKKEITVTLSSPSAGDTLGTSVATCAIGKK